MKKHSIKGFTLAELLIVVAIIAVLVAIGIPIFKTLLEKSRESTDLANARSAYAEVVAEVTSGNTGKTVSFNLKQTRCDWQSVDPITIGEITHSRNEGDTANWKGIPDQGKSCTVSFLPESGILFDWGGEATETQGCTTVDWPGFRTEGKLAKELLPTGVDAGVIYSTDETALSENEKKLLKEVRKKLGVTGDVAIHYGWNPYPNIKISVVEASLKKEDYTEKNTYSEGCYATRITYDPSSNEIVKVEKEYGKWGLHSNGRVGFWGNNMGGKYPTEELYHTSGQ